MPHQLAEHHRTDVAVDKASSERMSQSMNIDMRCGKLLTPSLERVLNRAYRHSLLALQKKEGRKVIGPRRKILGVENQCLFINEEDSYFVALAEYFSATLNTLLTVL